MINRTQKRERGQSILEITLLVPWIFFLFVGVLDVGFLSYAAICTENAARVGAMHAASDKTLAADPNLNQIIRTDVCAEMKSLPNVGTGCPASVLTVSAVAQPFTGADGQPATQVTVTYHTVALIPIPGVLGATTFTRSVQTRL